MKRLAIIFAVIAAPASAQQPRSGSMAPPAMQRIAPGLAGYTDDVLFRAVRTAPGVRHWHGAAPDSVMSHVAVSEAVDGRQVV